VGEDRRGRKLVLTGDTAPSDVVVEVADGADVLVHEATFTREEADRALETQHSTAEQAARVARDADVRMLALVHLSTRYGGREIREEARAAFPATVVPRDFDAIEIPFPERGGPELMRWEPPAGPPRTDAPPAAADA
jgi:ribonuclease Z